VLPGTVDFAHVVRERPLVVRSVVIALVIARAAAAEPAAAPELAPDRVYVAVAGSVGFGTGSNGATAAGIDAGYRPGPEPVLAHALVLVGEFEPYAGGFSDPPAGPSGSYLAVRAGIETDACTRAWSCLIFGADVGYVQEHASQSSEIDPGVVNRAAVVAGRLGFELRAGAVRVALTADGQVGYGRGFSTDTSPSSIGVVLSLGGRI